MQDMNLYIYTYVCTHMYVHIDVYTCKNMYVYIYIYTYMYIYIHISTMYICIHMYVYIYIYNKKERFWGAPWIASIVPRRFCKEIASQKTSPGASGMVPKGTFFRRVQMGRCAISISVLINREIETNAHMGMFIFIYANTDFFISRI